jgi:hypothetical protein
MITKMLDLADPASAIFEYNIIIEKFKKITEANFNEISPGIYNRDLLTTYLGQGTTLEAFNEKVEKINAILAKYRENIYIKNNDDGKNSLTWNIIKNLKPEGQVLGAVFGHSIASDFKEEESKYQTGFETKHHTILTAYGGQIAFVDIALSEAFKRENNNFYELYHYNTKEHYRVYTDNNRYQLGAPTDPITFRSSDNKSVIPKLN